MLLINLVAKMHSVWATADIRVLNCFVWPNSTIPRICSEKKKNIHSVCQRTKWTSCQVKISYHFRSLAPVLTFTKWPYLTASYISEKKNYMSFYRDCDELIGAHSTNGTRRFNELVGFFKINIQNVKVRWWQC